MFRKIHYYIPELLRLPRPLRRLIVVAGDLTICSATVWIAFWLRLGELDWINRPLLTFLAVANITWLLVASSMGTYRSVVRFSGTDTVFRLLPVFLMVSAVLAAILLTMRFPGVPRTLAVIHPLVFFLIAASMRVFAAQLIWNAIHLRSRRGRPNRVLIYGAGSAGQQLAQSMRLEPGLALAGFVDDNWSLKGRTLEGKKIWHSSEIERVLVREDVSEIYLAMASARRGAKRQIVERIQGVAPGIRVRALPSLSQIAFDSVSINDLREVQIEELLGRDEIPPSPELLERDIRGKAVLVTGAGGSIGSELARQALRQFPRKLILADQSEHALYLIDSELQELCVREGLQTKVVPALCDVADKHDCARLFEEHVPETVFHAAAYKHVPMVEINRLVGVRNNIFGTLYCALNAERVLASKFVLVSTDKAVRPTNLMGTSKRVCELIIQARVEIQSETRFTAVRFGNVLGSSGSVIPRFRDQIAAGGPVTVTHREATRYFMTVPEAAQLVIQAGAMGDGGDVFLLDMGDPVRILDLARSMIELSGLTVRDAANPDGDIEISEVGLRLGEKLFEELLIDANSCPTEHPRIVRARETSLCWTELQLALESLGLSIRGGNQEATVTTLKTLVPGYRPTESAAPITDESGPESTSSVRRQALA